MLPNLRWKADGLADEESSLEVSLVGEGLARMGRDILPLRLPDRDESAESMEVSRG